MVFRRGNRLSPIQSDKHEVTWSNLAQNASAIQSITICNAVVPSAADASTEVVVGSHVNWIYFEFHFSPEVVTNPKVIHWTLIKTRFGQTIPSPALYNQDVRRQILKRGMEMLPSSQSTVFKRIFAVKIPRGYANMQKGDVITLAYICSSTETINACGIAIYKAYY